MTRPDLMRALGFFGAALASSCATPRSDYYLSQHVLPVDGTGELDSFEFSEPTPPGYHEPHRGKTLDEHIGILVSSALAYAAENSPGTAEVLVHIHGGRNSRTKAARGADRILAAMHPITGSSPYATNQYPIFVLWPSQDIETAWCRLTGLRQGRRLGAFWGTVTMPLVFVHDIARGVIRMPTSLVYQYFRDFSVGAKVGFGWTPMRTWVDSFAIAEAMTTNEGKPLAGAPFAVNEPEYDRTLLDNGWRAVRYLPTQVAKVPVQTLFLEGLGQGAWDEMRRRALNLVWNSDTYEARLDGLDAEFLRQRADQLEPNGALPKLFRQLAEAAKEDGAPEIRLTIVAHSMGAIAVNEALQSLDAILGEFEVDDDENPIAKDDRRFKVERIIYMAPACTVSDAAEAIVPFLEGSEDTEFNLLTLHPIAEADEINFYDLVPRGSLLEWIDNYYSNQANHAERVLGKWSNAMPALTRFARVKDRVTVKAFDVAPGCVPQKHGHFHAIPFWHWRAYSPDGDTSFAADALEAIRVEEMTTRRELSEFAQKQAAW